ncbi:uncharacterized protein E0L32_000500 [Thyridium curvatum]|uniref:Uncharacterized protein n=1 Tax=Thyridium curvatum TaxID=1093900 RepID=A0A507B4U3_9PEZI|nr:uncharacterized protein E0L32_000500 [Thyridium curvatum]TPX14106.1 hypothetical protein E0L32_000500 [Thyridium curvatum]
MEPTKRRLLGDGSFIEIAQAEKQEIRPSRANPNNVTWQLVNSRNGDEEMQTVINKFGDMRLITPPSQLESLPTEILHKILSHIIPVDKDDSTDLSCPESREAFYRLCLVSRRISSVAYPFMYKNVAIKNQHSLTRLARQVIQNPGLRPLIRSLVVRYVLCETPGNTDQYYHLKQVLSTTHSFSRPPESFREARLRRFVQELSNDRRPCLDYHHAVVFLLLHYLPQLECIRLQTRPPTWPAGLPWLRWFWRRFWQQMTCETVGPDRYVQLPSAMIAAHQGIMALAQNRTRGTKRRAVGDDSGSSENAAVLMPIIKKLIFDWDWPAHSAWRQNDTAVFDLSPSLSSQPAEPLGNRVTSLDILMEHPNTFTRLSEVLVDNEVMKHLRLRTDGIACFHLQPYFWQVKIPMDGTKPNELLKKWTRSLRTLRLDLLLDQRASIYMFGSPRDAHLTSVRLLDNLTDLTITLQQLFRRPQAMEELLQSAAEADQSSEGSSSGDLVDPPGGGPPSHDLVNPLVVRFPKSLVNLTLIDWWSCRILPDRRRWGRFRSSRQDKELMGDLLRCMARRLSKTTTHPHPRLRTVTAVAVWPYRVKAWGNEMHWAYGVSPEEYACALHLGADVKFTLLMRKINVGRDFGLRDDGRDREDDDVRDVDMG